MENKSAKSSFKLGNAEYLAVFILVVLFAAIMYNSVRITALPGSVNQVSANAVSSSSSAITQSTQSAKILPVGIPEIYGEELGISYDGVSPNDPRKADETIGVLKNIDNTLTLTGDDLQRYIRIVTQISCEYCCGAKSIIFEDGRSACGCAHSYAMRGLAKYLIKNHGDKYTDDEILGEVGKWKVLFFPGIHETKAAVMESQGIGVDYVSLTSNKYRGIEEGKSSSGGMVGGC